MGSDRCAGILRGNEIEWVPGKERKMENKHCKDIKVLASMADHRGELSIPAVFSLFMDLATEHASFSIALQNGKRITVERMLNIVCTTAIENTLA